MSKSSLALLALASLASGMTAASAADLPVRPVAPVVAPAPLWTGWYFGGNFGYGWGTGSDSLVSVLNPTSVGITSVPVTSVDPKGVVGGLQVGYNWQFGYSWVLGIVADIQASGIDDSDFVAFANGTTAGQTSKIQWFGTVRGKLGWAAGNWLFYGTGGLAYGEVDVAATLAVPNVVIFRGDEQDTRVGWTAGGGIDYALNNNLTVGLEYLYLDLGRESATAVGFRPNGAATAALLSLDQRFKANIVRATINWRFSPY